jgi:hypothetical protein
MNNILTAIHGKTVASALSTDVGGRIYLDRAPDNCEYPYCVYSVVVATPEKTFTEHYTNTLIQFSLFSSSSGATEITTMYNDLKSLFDECSLTITSNTLVWMKEQNLTTMVDDVTTPAGLQTVKHWAADFEVLTSLS